MNSHFNTIEFNTIEFNIIIFFIDKHNTNANKNIKKKKI